jgi:tRNA-specific 2-thiouridylase
VHGIMARVVMAMSGGVDSSVAACLLQEAGHDVIGVFMRHGVEAEGWSEPSPGVPNELPIGPPRADHKQGCCSAADAADARRVADRLDIPFYALNLQAEFGRIIDYFVEEYGRGRTPNPCVVCNHWLKFGKLFEYADSVDAEHVATGHYARCVRTASGATALCRGIDPDKDQSYALFGISRPRLDRMLLPVGDFHKTEIRRRAGALGLSVAAKRDSQEICFVADGDHGRFVRARRGGAASAGRLVTTDGRVVGRHDGIERFTIGQRKGLGVALGEPYFVVRIDADTHDVVIGRHPELARGQLTARATNWLAAPPSAPFRCAAQIRYNSDAVAATARVLADDRLEVEFDDPCYGVAPGQAVVCYEGPRVLGGGWIE